eukprot:252902_1
MGDNRILAYSYIGIQLTVAIAVSIIGAVHVRRCSQEAIVKQIQTNQQIELSAEKDANRNNGKTDNIQKKNKTFCEMWVKTVWKMRGVYAGLAVHTFDVLTDILVILQWLKTDEHPGDNVNHKIMAFCALGVIAFSRIVSSIAIYIKERSIPRFFLQLFDLLIFQEIFESHRKIVSQIRNKKMKDKDHPIESTLSFKYVRNMEAVFESIPESVLQLVYVMRIGTSTINNEWIFIVSIVQSIISMTNSILNNDYTRMQEDKWAKHKRRLPPTRHFIFHALCRLSEVVYRICVFALFWTVCEGKAFSIMLAAEMVFIIVRTIFSNRIGDIEINADSVLLGISSLIVVSSEEVYGGFANKWNHYWGKHDNNWCHRMSTVAANVFCCVGICGLCISIPYYIDECYDRLDIDNEISVVPLTRIGTSFIEIIIIIIWALVVDGRKKFLLEPEHGLAIFIAMCIFYVIYTQYMALFPNFALPLNVGVRSKWGYAFSNEFGELRKIKIPFKKMPYRRKLAYDDSTKYEIKDEATFWDEPSAKRSATAAVFALAHENHDIVQWLEEKGAVTHKAFSVEDARKLLKIDGVYND